VPRFIYLSQRLWPQDSESGLSLASEVTEGVVKDFRLQSDPDFLSPEVALHMWEQEERVVHTWAHLGLHPTLAPGHTGLL
jgi:hypothetical protein